MNLYLVFLHGLGIACLITIGIAIVKVAQEVKGNYLTIMFSVLLGIASSYLLIFVLDMALIFIIAPLAFNDGWPLHDFYNNHPLALYLLCAYLEVAVNLLAIRFVFKWARQRLAKRFAPRVVLLAAIATVAYRGLAPLLNNWFERLAAFL